MNRYRFLRTKRYPHPNGPKRTAGTVYPIDDVTAEAWLRAGIIEPHQAEAPTEKTPVEPKPKATARKRATSRGK